MSSKNSPHTILKLKHLVAFTKNQIIFFGNIDKFHLRIHQTINEINSKVSFKQKYIFLNSNHCSSLKFYSRIKRKHGKLEPINNQNVLLSSVREHVKHVKQPKIASQGEKTAWKANVPLLLSFDIISCILYIFKSIQTQSLVCD